MLICELNTFYLKFVMWAPPDHPIVLGRLWFVAAAGAVAVREAYDFLSGVTAEIGQSAWIAVAVIITGRVRNSISNSFMRPDLVCLESIILVFWPSVAAWRGVSWARAAHCDWGSVSTRSPCRVDCVGGNRDRSIRPLLFLSQTTSRREREKAFQRMNFYFNFPFT